MHRTARPLVLLAALLALPLAVSAQTPEEILARYTSTIDPEGKIASLDGMKSTITMEIPAAGMRANVTAYQARPNLMALVIEIPGLGTMRQGFDGTVAWGSDPMQGPRIITGGEASALADGADMNAMARTPALFTSMEAAGDTLIDGDKVTCLKLTWKSGRITTECYSLNTGLLVESRSKQQSQMGEIEAVTRYGDYKAVNGVLVAHRVAQSAMGMQQVMTLTAVEFGKQASSHFEMPPEVRALRP